MPISVYALAVGAFAICTSEFVIMGLLLDVARDLNVSISSAGFLVTAYALGVVIGAPLLMPFLGRIRRKPVLIGLMILFTVGNLACAIAPTYNSLMAARVVAALAQANFFGVASIVAAKLAPPGKQASAIAAIFLGVTLANVAGAPAGTAIGQLFGWRTTFIAVALVSLIAALSTAWLVPETGEEEQPKLRQEIRVLFQPGVLRAMLITVLGFGGIFTVFTYVAPLLTEITGLSPSLVPALILLFGIGMMVGAPIGGKLADRALVPALRISLLSLVAALALVGFSLHTPVAMAISLFLFGVAGFTTPSPLQMQVMAEASKAPSLASAVNIGAFNLGNAAGAWLGGLTVDSSLGLTAVPWVGALITLSGLALTMTVRARRADLVPSSS